MATSNQVTQNGNSTQNWTLTGVSTHECIVLKPETGSSWMELERIRVRLSPTRYELRIRVIGAGAMAFRIKSEKMD